MIKTPKPTEEADEAETNGADKGIDINQCLKLFTEEEQLREGEEWYCSNCKDHKRFIILPSGSVCRCKGLR